MPPADPFFASELPWEMSPAERHVLVGLLDRLRPDVALEIGTHFGGSLQAIAPRVRQVHSIDLDPAVARALAGRFVNARFHTGSSLGLIDPVMREVEAAGADLDFVLVDGDHTAGGVRQDIDTLLRHRPRRERWILMHDSFNPDCRAGLRRAAWAGCPFVHAVELDLVPGTFHEVAAGGAFARSMWGGFALAVLRPEPRPGPLRIGAAQEALHQLVYRGSAHRLWHKAGRWVRRHLAR